MIIMEMTNDPDRPLQSFEFFGSKTELWHLLRDSDRIQIAEELHLSKPGESLTIIRHTIMNPWLSEPAIEGASYLDRYVEYMTGIVRKAVKEWQTKGCKHE